MIKKLKVFVGLSGGVDSAVSALLLKKAGYNVVGVFIKVWSPDWLPCAWPEERRDAMRVCAHLGIPFVTLNLEREYKRDVVDYMIREYKMGRTPNPDVMCNKEIKFGAFYDWAIARGADFVATGHYAQISGKNQTLEKLQGSTPGGNLLKGRDKDKDQSYFLWNLKQEQFKHVLFPVGGLLKNEVRKIAKKSNLPVAEKKDSQGICFLGKFDMKEFLKHYIKEKQGLVIDEKGETIGHHDGAFFYTIGEHIPLGHRVSKWADEKKLFVTSKDINKNTLTVSPRRPEEISEIKEFKLTNVNWLNGSPLLNKICLARVRYRQELQKVKILSLRSRASKLLFDKPQTVDVGQSIVLYQDDICLGGGIVL